MSDAIVRLNYQLENKQGANVLCFNNMIESPTFLQSFADAIRASLVLYVDQFWVDKMVLNNITVSFIDATSVTYSVDVDFTDGPLTGSAVDDTLAPQLALLTSLDYIGPKPNRGRIYWYGFGEQQITDGSWNSTIRTAFSDMVNSWVGGIAHGEGTNFLRILRRPSDIFPNYVSSPVSAVRVTRYARTQRRRSIPTQ